MVDASVILCQRIIDLPMNIDTSNDSTVIRVQVCNHKVQILPHQCSYLVIGSFSHNKNEMNVFHTPLGVEETDQSHGNNVQSAFEHCHIGECTI